MRDLSPGGIRVDKASDLRVGATVLISVGALEAVGATVKWVKDGFAGLAFAKAIDPEQARARAAIAPRSAPERPAAQVSATVPGAGWVADLRSPYRR